MAEIFPKWTNEAPRYLAVSGLGFALLGSFSVWYFFSPEYTDVGYRPHQPVAFSHKLHVGELEIDCRYCHTSVETSSVASVPPTGTCLNCHQLVKRDSEALEPVRLSRETNEPIHWIRVHNLPEYTYFNHSVHVQSGIGCSSCHGNVAVMEKIRQVATLSMSWCLDCHRNPAPHLRLEDEITNPRWSPPADQAVRAKTIMDERDIEAPVDCSGCHR